MIVYWLMFAIPALASLASGENRRGAPVSYVPLIIVMLIFTILIGFRFEVGGDWFNYERIVEAIRYEDLGYTLQQGDPGFGLIAWLATRTGTSDFLPSLFCGGVLIWGVFAFVSQQKYPWLALTAAVPYLLIVVGMGYVRQAAAIGFLLLALLAFERRSLFHFGMWMVMAILFHVTAIAILPLAAFAILRKNKLALVPLALATAALYVFLLQDRLQLLVTNYVDAGMESSGAAVRLAMNAIPGFIFVLLRKRFVLNDPSGTLWLILALSSIGLFAAVMAFSSSTVLDRLGLYLIPVQLFVFGNLPARLSTNANGQKLLGLLIVAYYAVALYVWLNFADNSESWLPYRFLFFGGAD